MTRQKHLKRRVRERMRKTGESYVSARRMVLLRAPRPTSDATSRLHFAGNVPAATALRTVLGNHGVRHPQTGQPFSEAMVFGISGGLGIGVFAFRYEQEDSSSFFIAGRHQWEDDLGYFQRAIPRFGATAETREATGAKKGAAQLLELLQGGRPVIAWVDAASLPYRGMPSGWSGGGYHVLVVYAVDEAAGQAIVGDLADTPITLSLDALHAARGRIRKDKRRLLALRAAARPIDLGSAVEEGLRACAAGLTQGRSSNFTLQGLKNWSQQLAASGQEGWGIKFAPGPNLWRGLTSIYDFIEQYGTGGGLSRPLFADFLQEASEALNRADLAELAQMYARLGREWSALAEAALPDAVVPFRQAKDLMTRKAELFLSEGASGRDDYAAIWKELDLLAGAAADSFPLQETERAALLGDLSARVAGLYKMELHASAALERAAG